MWYNSCEKMTNYTLSFFSLHFYFINKINFLIIFIIIFILKIFVQKSIMTFDHCFQQRRFGDWFSPFRKPLRKRAVEIIIIMKLINIKRVRHFSCLSETTVHIDNNGFLTIDSNLTWLGIKCCISHWIWLASFMLFMRWNIVKIIYS